MTPEPEHPRGPSCATGCAVFAVLVAFAVLVLAGGLAMGFGVIESMTSL